MIFALTRLIFLLIFLPLILFESFCFAKAPDPCAKVIINVKRSTDSAGIAGANVKVTNWRGQPGIHTTNSAGQVILDATDSHTNPVLTNEGYSSGKGSCSRTVRPGKKFKVTAEATVSGFSGGSGATTLTHSNPHGEITIYLSPQSGGHNSFQPSSGATEIVFEAITSSKPELVFLHDIDGIGGAKWNPAGRYPPHTGDYCEEAGKRHYVINLIYPKTPKAVTHVSLSFPNKTKNIPVNLPFIRKRQMEICGMTYYDVMYARFSDN